jgi:hypothetical protein
MRGFQAWRVIWAITLGLLWSSGTIRAQDAQPVPDASAVTDGETRDDAKSADVAPATDTSQAQENGTSNSSGSVQRPDASVVTDNEMRDDANSADDAPATDTSQAQENGTSNSSSWVRRLGTAFPVGMDPGGYRIGAVHVLDITSSGFYEIAQPQGHGSQDYWGTSIASSLFYQHTLNKGSLIVQANPVLASIGGNVYTRQEAALDFTTQLSARWSLSASSQFSYYQNAYLLETPQYLLAYAAGGIVLQQIYAQRNGATLYETNGFSMNYHLNGTTQLTITPNLNINFADVDGRSYFLNQLGGGASLSHSLSADRSVLAFVNYNHSTTTEQQSPGSGGWNTYTLGLGVNQRFARSWYLSVTGAATYQQGPYSSWTPTGSITLLKVFRGQTISAAYTRTTAEQPLLSRGYFDQADIGYFVHIARNITAGGGVGEFRAISTGNHQDGRRAYASLSYRWLRSLAWTAGYSYSSQTGNQPSLYLGTINFFSVGLSWYLGHQGS